MFKKRKIWVILSTIILIGLIVNTVYFMNKETKLRMYFHPDKLGFMGKQIEAFEKENPRIKIELIELPDNTNEKYEVISQALALEDGQVDIVSADVTWPAIFVESDWVEPLDSYFSNEDLDHLLKSAIGAGQIGDELYGISYRIDSGLLYYRKDLLEQYGYEVPKTWEELILTSKDIMAKEEGMYGMAGSWAEFEGLTCNFLEFLWSYDGEVLNHEGETVINSPNSKKALNIMSGMINTDGITPPDVTSFKSGDVRDLFNEGNLIFMRDWPTGWRKAQNPEYSKVVGNVGVAPLPFGEGHDDSHGTFGGWMYMVSKHSNNKDEAVKFIKFMLREDVEKEMVLTHNYLPSVKSLYTDEDVLDRMPYLEEMMPFLNDAWTRPQVGYYDKITYIIQREVSRVLNADIESDDGIEEMDKKITESAPGE